MLYVSWSKESRPDLGAMLGQSGTDKLATVKEGDGPKRTVQLSRALFVLLSRPPNGRTSVGNERVPSAMLVQPAPEDQIAGVCNG